MSEVWWDVSIALAALGLAPVQRWCNQTVRNTHQKRSFCENFEDAICWKNNWDFGERLRIRVKNASVAVGTRAWKFRSFRPTLYFLVCSKSCRMAYNNCRSDNQELEDVFTPSEILYLIDYLNGQPAQRTSASFRFVIWFVPWICFVHHHRWLYYDTVTLWLSWLCVLLIEPQTSPSNRL